MFCRKQAFYLANIVGNSYKPINLRNILFFPITEVSLSFAHSDKTTKELESKQTYLFTDLSLPPCFCQNLLDCWWVHHA